MRSAELNSPAEEPRVPRELPPGSNDLVWGSASAFRAAFETHAAVMWLIDPVNGAILDANQAAADFHRSPREQMRRLTVFDLTDLPREQVAAELARCRQPRHGCWTFPHRLTSGEVRWVEVHASPLTLAGRTLLWAVVHDVTERQKLEAVGQFAGGMAHDFNNLLTAILGHVSLLERSSLTADQRRHLAACEQAARRTAELTQQMLSLARRGAWRPPSTAAAPAPARPVVSGTVLLVDDDAAVRNLARDVLEGQGYRVLVAEDGLKAMDLFARSGGEIDLVVLDQTMPRQSGAETLRQLRRLDPTVKVLLSSGYSDETAPVEGALGTLDKPYQPAELLAAVARALR